MVDSTVCGSLLTAHVMDTVLNCSELDLQAEQFGGWKFNTTGAKNLFLYPQNPLYIQDTFGLQTLDGTGRLATSQFQGDHLQFNDTYWNEVRTAYR
jgi:hypothetical protein